MRLYVGLVLAWEEKLCADRTNHTISGVALLHFLLPITSVLQSDDHKRGCSLILFGLRFSGLSANVHSMGSITSFRTRQFIFGKTPSARET